MAHRLIERPAASGARPAALRDRLDAMGHLAAPAGMAAVVIATGAAQAAVLGHYFFGDDFVPLADIASRSTPAYLRDLVLMNDLTPNWRVLPGLFYLAFYRVFGLSALPFFVANVALHAATALLVFHLVRRATLATWPALLAAAFFGTTAAHVPTVGQVTAFNNVLAAFLVMVAIVLLYEGLDSERSRWWWAGSFAAFAGAIAANESTAVLAPVLGLVVLWRAPVDGPRWRDRRAWPRLALLMAPFALLGATALAGFGACRCTEAADLYETGDHLVSNVWLYLGRLLYPVGLELPGRLGTAHLVAGPVAGALALAMLVRGPALARVAVVFLALALVPFLPIAFWSASRYVYMAAIPFSILAALLFVEAERFARSIAPAAPALVACVAIGVLGLLSWQTWSQNDVVEGQTDEWHALVTGLESALPALPEGATVYVRGSALDGPLLQCAVMPSLGEALWGGVKLFTFLEGGLDGYRVRPGYDVYVLDETDGRFARVDVPVATEAELSSGGVTLLPHVDPAASGNLCLSGDEASL